MKTFDDNWQALKDEDRSLPEPKHHNMSDAEDFKLIQWFNNPNNPKLTWRERMSPQIAWFDQGDAKGMWRSKENRLFEEIQYEYSTKHFGQGYRIVKSTARLDGGDPMLNVKMIQVIQHKDDIKEVLLILDGHRVLLGYPVKVKNALAWKFRDSILIDKIL